MTIKDAYDAYIRDGSTHWAKTTQSYYEQNIRFFLDYLVGRFGIIEQLELSALPESD